MKKLVILVLVLAVAAVFWSKKSEKSQEKNPEVNSDTEETDSVDTESDEEYCSMARKDNTRRAWEIYLERFPKGKCAEEGRSVRDKYKRIGNLEWSNAFDSGVYWSTAYTYCKNLNEDGHSDWRLPSIDELRLLVQNHSGTISGGKCKISEEHNKLNDEDRTEDCEGRKEDDSSEFDDRNRQEYVSIKVVDNFSKFGDNELLWSSSESLFWGESLYQATWVVNFDNGECVLRLGAGEYLSESLSVRCVRQDEQDACETAKKYNKFYYWQHYLKNFPNGKCAGEAKAFIEKEDKKVCEEARKENTRSAWEKYLKKFPKGKCSAEGKKIRNKFKKIGGYEWSDISDEPISADEAIGNDDDSYCRNLEEDGHKDWRLPTIDELRVLVQNHPGTIIGGKCRISELDDHLDEDFDDENCKGIGGFNFSKLGDKEELLSSSGYATPHFAYDNSINFYTGGFSKVEYDYRSDYYPSLYVRCVRQDDSDACETAKKYNIIHYWSSYLKDFPNGKCSAEAKNALDELSCEEAKNKKSSYSWQHYLGDFQQGKCAKEAKNKIKGICAIEEAENKIETKKVEPKNWSSRSPKAMNWKQANKYCENLKEGGSSDWRLPTISELRTLITKCENTEAGGTCGVTDQCLSVGECKNRACRGCGRKVQHNKLGDKGFFWSSSISSDSKNAWYIDFTYGSIHSHSNSEKFVRCVSPEISSDAGTKVSTEKDDSHNSSKKTFPYKDLQTGYIWSGVSKKVMDWDSAKQYCAGLKEGNENDWRLPNIDELRTLIQKCPQTETGGMCGVAENCLSQSSCQNTACMGCESKDGHNKLGDKGFFWSSSISPDNNNAWYIDFTYASVHSHSKSEKHVRCIRSEIASDSDREIPAIEDDSCDSSAKTFPCKDSQTGYVWSDISERVMDWDAAKQYCKKLKEGTGNDWRLPDIDELRTLLKSGTAATDGTCKVSAKNKCLDSSCWSMETCFEDACRVSEEKCFFKDGRYSKLEDGRNNNVWLWSSSVKSDKNKSNKKGNAWYIDFNKGSVHDYRKDSKFYVRCVR